MIHAFIKKGCFQDSVSLMIISRKLSESENVDDVSVMMGTPANKALLDTTGFWHDDFNNATPNDICVAIRSEAADAGIAQAIMQQLEEALKQLAQGSGSSQALTQVRRWDSACQKLPDANLALISVAGEYAAELTNQALDRNLNVMMFSDNVTLEDEIDLSRGEMLVKPEDRPFSGHHFKAMTVWMDETRMDRNKAFFLKQTTNTTRAHIGEIDFRVDVNTLEQMHSDGLALNEVGLVHISTSSVLMYDSYRDNKATGAFIIIDPVSNFTSGVGMIIGPDDEAAGSGSGSLVIDMAALGIEAGHYDAIEKACAYMRSKGIDVKCKK